MRKFVLFIAALWLLNACGLNATDPDADVKEQACKFAEAYFNYDFVKARRFVTPESEKWLRFAASIVTQEDVDLINATSETVSVSVTDCYHQNDSTARVTMTVYNAVVKDSLERPARMASETEVALMLVRRGDEYRVKMWSYARYKSACTQDL